MASNSERLEEPSYQDDTTAAVTPSAGAPDQGAEASSVQPGQAGGESTVGTGSSIAIGCTIIMLIVTAIGVAIILVSRAW
jgi:hypothetical protein